MSGEGKEDTQTPHSDSSLKEGEKGPSGPEFPAEKESNAQSQDFPDGGFAGWATAIGACVDANFLTAVLDTPNDS